MNIPKDMKEERLKKMKYFLFDLIGHAYKICADPIEVLTIYNNEFCSEMYDPKNDIPDDAPILFEFITKVVDVVINTYSGITAIELYDVLCEAFPEDTVIINGSELMDAIERPYRIRFYQAKAEYDDFKEKWKTKLELRRQHQKENNLTS